MSSEGKKAFFAAANTGKGFVSFFEETFFAPSITRRYIIKGGPGTGKSSFMKKIARCADAEGMDVEYYYCSSDTRSLDGIVLNGSVAIFDGTSPHSYDAVLPGACDEIINLGQFWSRDVLAMRRNEISALDAQKKHAYSSAYGYLYSAYYLSKNMSIIRGRMMLGEKLLAAVRKTYERFGCAEDTGECEIRQVSALGTHGSVRFDTLESLAKHKYRIRDYYGIGREFLRELWDMSRLKRTRCCVSFDVVDTEYPTELYFPDIQVWIGIDDGTRDDSVWGDSVISAKRFADSELVAAFRSEYRTAQKAYDTLLLLASECLKRSGEIHARLESIYVSSMDFSAQNEFCTRFIGEILR